MYPLDFEEFILALGYDNLNNILKENLIKKTEISKVFHDLALNLFRQYLIVGRMPNIVKSYIENKDLFMLRENQKNILRSFEMDFGRYINENNIVKRDNELFNFIIQSLIN